ncbi:hypothetical protein BKA56DRAFT_619631 [Ilyonectria sp. MPI-CAGE-AT-0026]|nr:hypothetical protein BKA56DRAFT_619631 [Ilyonectria sp. MPI-CAGE-AT-0026]
MRWSVYSCPTVSSAFPRFESVLLCVLPAKTYTKSIPPTQNVYEPETTTRTRTRARASQRRVSWYALQMAMAPTPSHQQQSHLEASVESRHEACLISHRESDMFARMSRNRQLGPATFGGTVAPPRLPLAHGVAAGTNRPLETQRDARDGAAKLGRLDAKQVPIPSSHVRRVPAASPPSIHVFPNAFACHIHVAYAIDAALRTSLELGATLPASAIARPPGRDPVQFAVASSCWGLLGCVRLLACSLARYRVLKDDCVSLFADRGVG